MNQRGLRRALVGVMLLAFSGCGEVSDIGSVRGQVIDGYEQQPVAHARIEVDGVVLRTDASGRFETELPRGTYEFRLQADGYISGRQVHVVIKSNELTSIQPEIFPEVATEHAGAMFQSRLPILPNRLEPAFSPRRTDSIGSTASGLTDPSLPTEIRVWRARNTSIEPSRANGYADRSCDGDVLTLPLEEYVKGVVPHEWVPSWHIEALKAGAVAARSYASAWALQGGRWACADVDDGTLTQVYSDGRSDRADEAVDATQSEVVFRDGQVVKAEYSAENGHPTAGWDIQDPVCSGSTLFGHGRGMCQEGTQRWATGTCFQEPCDFGEFGSGPKDYVWMVEHYYPGAHVAGGSSEPPPPCGEIPADGGTIDELGPCFRSYGNSAYWRQVTDAGESSHLLWTNAFKGSNPSNWAQWTTYPVEAGHYRVEAYIDAAYGVFDATRYRVDHNGVQDTVVVNQSEFDGWASLGEFEFAAGAGQAVSVFDSYDAAVPAEQHIVADAIRLVRLDAATVTEPPLAPERELSDAGVVDGSAVDASIGHVRFDAETSGCRVASVRGLTASSNLWLYLGLGLVLVARRRRR